MGAIELTHHFFQHCRKDSVVVLSKSESHAVHHDLVVLHTRHVCVAIPQHDRRIVEFKRAHYPERPNDIL